jgi:hypothetical protein
LSLLLFGSDWVALYRVAASEREWNARIKGKFLAGMSEPEAEAELQKLGLSTYWNEYSHQVSSSIGGEYQGFMMGCSLRIVVHLGDDNKVKDAEVKRVYSAWM